MKKNNIKYLVASLVMFTGFNSCETVDLDQLVSPVAVTEDQLDPNQLFNSIQLGFNNFVFSTAGPTSFSAQVTRSFGMIGGNQYENAFSPLSFNGIWSTAYAGVLNDIKALEPVAQEQGNTYQLGASKVMKAYVLFTLVDYFGDVPLSEALLGNENQFPTVDSQIDVYTAALSELDEAISLLATATSSLPSDDMYFAANNGGVPTVALQKNWITAAKTLKLRVYNNIRLNGSAIGLDVSGRINALLAENDLIDTPEEDWQFNYGSTRLNPNSRHPGYNQYYENDAAGYMSNYLMWTMISEKDTDDPRLKYYFYRQDGNATNENIFTLGCAVQSAPGHYGSVTSIYNSNQTPFCTANAPRGYWGRDHGDNGGIPPDNTKRTIFGVYPVGGLFDSDDPGNAENEGEDGLLGKGIQPIIKYYFVDFIKAEAALTLGTTGNARVLLESGIRNSIKEVVAFAKGTDGASAPSTTVIQNYVDIVLGLYDTSDNAGKLNIIMKEYQIATFGNSLETYNGYRRTGFPSNYQPTLDPNSGDFYRSALYPANFVNVNTNASQKARTEQIFWDTNPAGFIN